MNGKLTFKDEQQIIYLIDKRRELGLICENVELLIKCYNALLEERNQSKQLLYLCEFCKDNKKANRRKT